VVRRAGAARRASACDGEVTEADQVGTTWNHADERRRQPNDKDMLRAHDGANANTASNAFRRLQKWRCSRTRPSIDLRAYLLRRCGAAALRQRALIVIESKRQTLGSVVVEARGATNFDATFKWKLRLRFSRRHLRPH
jgi:hypothetical protein